MKTLLTTCLLCLLLFQGNAQTVNESEVPDNVKSAFKKQFPTAKAEKWEKEGDDYEAEFHFNKTETCAMFSSGGRFLGTEVEIPVSELPAGVNTYVSTQLNGKKIKEAARLTDHKGVVTYEAEVDGADYIFDANGAFLKKELEDHKGEDKD